MFEILSNSNLDVLLLSFIPAAFYSMIFYMSSPFKSIDLKKGLLYFVLGSISILFVHIAHAIFPNWRAAMSVDPDLALFFFAFIQVALLEEVAKFTAFSLTDAGRPKSKKDHPVAIMFYSMAVALGFSVIETFNYGLRLGDSVIVVRAFTAIFCHMVAGIGMGYFIALGRSKFRLGTHSALDIALNKRRKLKLGVYSLLGIIFATFYHGLYDHNLMTYSNASFPLMVFILGLGIWICYKMFDHLNKIHKEEVENERTRRIKKDA